jgi:hypothetical protein
MMDADRDCIVDAEAAVVAAVYANEGTMVGVVEGGKEGTGARREKAIQVGNNER